MFGNAAGSRNAWLPHAELCSAQLLASRCEGAPPLCLLERLKDKLIPGISQSSLRAALMASPAADGFRRSLHQPENRREAEQCYPCPFLSSPERDSQLYAAQRLPF